MTTHTLKTWPPFFGAILDGTKTFEVRENDRDFQVGDLLNLVEWDPSKRDPLTGRAAQRRVTYILHGSQWGISPGCVVLALGAP